MESKKKFKLFNIINMILLILVCISVIYPFINTLAYSLSEGLDARRGGIYFVPRVFSLKSYEAIFSSDSLKNAYLITISKTVLGVFGTILFTGMLAYGLSKPRLKGRKYYLIICIVGMIFNGGLIPTYMLYKDLNLTNNFLVYIVPRLTNVWYLILMKTYFEQMPIEFEEAARIDGCSTFQTFFKVILPVAKPIIATICIFEGVEQWNSWFDAYLYVTKDALLPVQTQLFKIISLAQVQSLRNIVQSTSTDAATTSIATLKAASIVITTIPILIIYLAFQKNIKNGVAVGSIKG